MNPTSVNMICGYEGDAMDSGDIEVSVVGTDVVRKVVKDNGESGVIYVPREYVGKNVVIVILK